MRDIEWDQNLLDWFEKGQSYIVNNSQHLMDIFCERFPVARSLYQYKYYYFKNGRLCHSDIKPDIASYTSITNMRKQYKVYIQDQTIPFEYLEKILSEKMKTHQVIVSGSTGEAVTTLSSVYGVGYEKIPVTDVDAWILKNNSLSKLLVILAKDNNIKVRVYNGTV